MTIKASFAGIIDGMALDHGFPLRNRPRAIHQAGNAFTDPP